MSVPAGHVRMPCRLAIRAEGKFINAYFAKQDTMNEAVLLGSVLKRLVEPDRDLFEAWKETMKLLYVKMIEQVLGTKPVMGPDERAPEHERSGSA